MSNAPPGPLERYRGALLGLAAGEALGAPLEFMSANQIQIRHGMVDAMVGGGWLDLRRGEWTDDTAMALALATSLVEKKGLDPADAAARYLELYRKGAKGLANTVRSALAEIDGGTPVADASRKIAEEAAGETDSSSALGRTAPIGLWYHADRRALVRASLDEARITHHDPRVGGAAAAINLILAEFLTGDSDLPALLERVNEALFANEEGALNVLPVIEGKSLLELRPSEDVVDTLEVALVSLVSTKSFRDAVVTAVNLGGNTATIGAVCGALAGCAYGAGGIPKDWLTPLKDRNLIEQAARRMLAT